jgi:hypothetical protein
MTALVSEARPRAKPRTAAENATAQVLDRPSKALERLSLAVTEIGVSL